MKEVKLLQEQEEALARQQAKEQQEFESIYEQNASLIA
jgi:hypothetical protein